MPEFASKGIAGTALGLAIPGTVALAGQLSNGDGLLGGLFGGGSKKDERIANLMAENTQLKGEKYTDSQIKEVNAEICRLGTEQVRQGEELTGLRREMELRDQLTHKDIQCVASDADCKIGRVNERVATMEQLTDCKIARVADSASCGIQNLNTALQCLQQTVAGITRTYVPAQQVTPLPSPWPFPPNPPYGPGFWPFPPQQQASSSSGTTTTPDATTGG